MKPQIVMPEGGFHNRDLKKSADRIYRGNTYRNANTICVVPTRGMIPAKVVQSWMSLQSPMNSAFVRMFMVGMEVGEAYSQAVEYILTQEETLKNFPYILTLEEDNIPPSDGLLKLIESINAQKLDVVGGLYWTKGEGGQPMIYGDPNEFPYSFRPQVPIPEAVQPCRGLGMGFTLFRTKIFTDNRLTKPFFKTQQEFIHGQGYKGFSQDLYAFDQFARCGFRVACDNRVKVGHYDHANDQVW